MLQVRRHISGLRRLLVAQRNVFYGLGRPDLLQGHKGAEAGAHYQALAQRYERAVDEVEHTRELLLGSFELFASRTSSDTNNLVKSLTFLTVVIGGVAAIAGLFGMNFDPPFFRTGAIGFFAVTGGLSMLAVIFWVVARRKRWI